MRWNIYSWRPHSNEGRFYRGLNDWLLIHQPTRALWPASCSLHARSTVDLERGTWRAIHQTFNIRAESEHSSEHSQLIVSSWWVHHTHEKTDRNAAATEYQLLLLHSLYLLTKGTEGRWLAISGIVFFPPSVLSETSDPHVWYLLSEINDLTIGWQNQNPLSHPNATLAPQARQARASSEF